MSRQRRRGVPITVYRTKTVTDNRDNQIKVVDRDNPYHLTAAVIPQRSARAELPGQMEINVIRVLIDPDLEGVSLWSEVDALGTTWDVVTPPAYHHGTRHTRHWSIDLRERPHG